MVLIARVLWEIWFFRNKKVWDNKSVTGMIVMEWSAKYFQEWKVAKVSNTLSVGRKSLSTQTSSHRWKAPGMGSFKLNTDAAIKLGDDTFSIGLVLRDHQGEFVGGKVKCTMKVSSVLEAEVLAIKDGLQCLLSLPYANVEVETDSLMAVQAIKYQLNNSLELGFVLDECRSILNSRPGLSITFAKRQANKVAHLMAKFPCLLDCQSILTSPPFMLLETLIVI